MSLFKDIGVGDVVHSIRLELANVQAQIPDALDRANEETRKGDPGIATRRSAYKLLRREALLEAELKLWEERVRL